MTSTASTDNASAAPIARPPRPAASLVVVRDSPEGVEVLLLLRTERGDHNSGAWVFPGGIVDRLDCDWHRCTGADDAVVSERLAIDDGHGGLDYVVAAIRECFEESGLLFADRSDDLPLLHEPWEALQSSRAPLHRGETTLGALCDSAGLRLAADRIAYLAHWLTPVGRPKRFDTRFFVGVAPHGQVVAHDGTEMVAHQWLRIVDALARADGLKLMTPTRSILQSIAHFHNVETLMRWARSPRAVPRIFPRMGTGRRGFQPVAPDEPAWAELGRLDPEGRGTACYDIEVDVPVRLSSRVIRVTADNGSVMTGPGTNTYLVGGGPANERNEWAVIDPGPLDANHVQAILRAAPGPIRWIFVTHTHVDHSPATVMLKAETGATVHGRVATHRERQDPTFVADRVLEDGDRITLDRETTLRAIHTPGHASNHLCYLLEEERTLFTGDHVMQGSTVVINPPDGDMAAYLVSLRALSAELGETLEWLAPGHGFLIERPNDAFGRIVEHRLRREAKVLSALKKLSADGPVSEPALLAKVYDDVPARMHPVALRSLTAHLIKLRDEGIVRHDDRGWTSTK